MSQRDVYTCTLCIFLVVLTSHVAKKLSFNFKNDFQSNYIQVHANKMNQIVLLYHFYDVLLLLQISKPDTTLELGWALLSLFCYSYTY